jgi:glycosyltransferase involved in cell wall biosynthesis
VDSSAIKAIGRELYKRAALTWRHVAGYPVVHDAMRGSGSHVKRALLVYLVKPFVTSPTKRAAFFKHQNFQQNLDIAVVLDQLGFIVDVAQFSDPRFRVEYEYDLLIGMGRTCRRVASSLSDRATKVYIATGLESGFNNRQEEKRIENVRVRRGCRVRPRRLSYLDPKELGQFDAIVCIGNEFAAATYRPHHHRIYCVNNYGYTEIRYHSKDVSTARHNFLFLASSGQVHKGLDLLLEVFAKTPDYHLYVCSLFNEERDFVRCYQKELFETPNIHPVGWTDLLSAKMSQIFHRCAYVACPSCADVQPGSVIVAMYAGLIPVVSQECSIDVDDVGVVLRSSDVKTIAATVSDLVEKTPEWVLQKSLRTRELAVSEYTQEAFRRRWRQILSEVLKRKKGPGIEPM